MMMKAHSKFRKHIQCKIIHYKIIHYVLSLVILLIVACNCNNEKPNQNPPEKFNNLTVLLCTANVHFFSDQTPQVILQALDNLRQEKDDIVIFSLQETRWTDPPLLQNILPNYQVYDYRGTSHDFANTLLVYNPSQLEMHFTGIELPLYHTERFASMVDFPGLGLKVANTHLVGGRYDDQRWTSFPQGREQQLQTIVKQQSTIIMGDFNADDQQRGPLQRYWKGLLQQAAGQSDQAIIAYKTNGHRYLSEQGYISLFDRKKISPTTPFGEVVDWIYINKRFNYQVMDAAMVPAINNRLSDHNFLWVRIQIPNVSKTRQK